MLVLGRGGGALVESMPSYQRVVGSNPALAATYIYIIIGTLDKSYNLQLPVALRREAPV